MIAKLTRYQYEVILRIDANDWLHTAHPDRERNSQAVNGAADMLQEVLDETWHD
jgi:hypothetical protein